MFDVSLDPSPGADLTTMPSADWTSGLDEQRKDVEMWMVGNHRLQEAHVSEQGKHGLFTYQLLRGLQGLADLDRDGLVVAGELCLYARGEVARVTRQQSGNKQDPLCLPRSGVVPWLESIRSPREIIQSHHRLLNNPTDRPRIPPRRLQAQCWLAHSRVIDTDYVH